ncbi:MAG: phosphatidylserine/phosphatidylglycerophosphate/cardiolipin synthase family protein [Deltaproteobacteria bacterium]|nr:phosphatidylserine/phosphatidylglycerophosphate/cardiolipin synthase family protein [Deltaproteobacteria bacterium]
MLQNIQPNLSLPKAQPLQGLGKNMQTVSASGSKRLGVTAEPATRAEPSQLILNTGRLVDHPTDKSSAEMISHMLKLRAEAAKGTTINPSDLIAYGKTSVGNQVDVALDRAYFTEFVIPEIKNAKDSIHIAMLTFDGGHFGQYLVDLLIEKKRENPEMAIRVLVDAGMSDASYPWSQGRKNLKRLEDAGIDLKLSSPLEHGLEHRKTIIIDGTTALVGASCIGDEYFANDAYWDAFTKASETTSLKSAREAAFSPGTGVGEPAFVITPEMLRPEYQDFGMKIQGPALHNLQAAFLQSWIDRDKSLEPGTNDADLVERYFPAAQVAGKMPVKLTHGAPWGPGEMQQNLLAIIHGAEKTLDIEMAYVHVAEFHEALTEAAKRGVKIRLITNSKDGIDFEPSWHIYRQYYEGILSEPNIKIFELKNYSHRKFMVADSEVVFSSSGQAEFNSWERGWDDIALIHSKELAASIEDKVFKHSLDDGACDEVTLASLQNESMWTQIKTAVITFFYNLFANSYRSLVSPHLNDEPRRVMVGPSSSKSKLLPVNSWMQPQDTNVLSPAPSIDSQRSIFR